MLPISEIHLGIRLTNIRCNHVAVGTDQRELNGQLAFEFRRAGHFGEIEIHGIGDISGADKDKDSVDLLDRTRDVLFEYEG